MKRTMFSLTLLLILSVALSGCSIVGSRISHALGDEENYIMNEEIITEKVESIDIDWRAGKVSITPWDGEDIVVKEKSDTTLTSRTKMRVRNQDGNLTVEDTAKGVWLLPLLFKKDLEVMVPVGVDLRIVDVKATSSSVYISELSVMDVNIESTSGDIVLDEMKVVGNAYLKRPRQPQVPSTLPSAIPLPPLMQKALPEASVSLSRTQKGSTHSPPPARLSLL